MCKSTGYYLSACAKMTGYYFAGVLFVRHSDSCVTILTSTIMYIACRLNNVFVIFSRRLWVIELLLKWTTTHYHVTGIGSWLLSGEFYVDSVASLSLVMTQSQCRRSVGDKFWPGVIVENKESLNNRSNNPNKSGAVTLSEIVERMLTRFCWKIMGWASDGLRLQIGDYICERLLF